jgi:hypothetical protein
MDGFRRMGNRSRSEIVSLAYSPIGHPIRRIAYRHPPYDLHDGTRVARVGWVERNETHHSEALIT